VRELGDEVAALFAQVLLICERIGLVGKTMFAIDGVKRAANASKERSGTHAELAHRADRLDKAAAKIVASHQAQDEHGHVDLDAQRQRRIEQLRREARVTREFIARGPRRLNAKGSELKTNLTDPESAKMATSKGVIQGYAAQAAVDSAHQIVVATAVIGSGSEQAMLLPMIDKAQAMLERHTLITADAGYHSDASIAALHERGIAAMVADNAMRQRDERIDNAHHKAKRCAVGQDGGQDSGVVQARELHLQRRPHGHLPSGQDSHGQRQHLRPARTSVPALSGAGRGLCELWSARAVPAQPAHPARPSSGSLRAQARGRRRSERRQCASNADANSNAKSMPRPARNRG
jgi:hypothetical protein